MYKLLIAKTLGRNSAEVKRATIVGNPMFSAEDNAVPDEPTGDLTGLDGLQLDMDYEQIMNYFDNLKVSNLKEMFNILFSYH